MFLGIAFPLIISYYRQLINFFNHKRGKEIMNSRNIFKIQLPITVIILVLISFFQILNNCNAANLVTVFEYSQTPNFVDLTKKYNQSAINTVATLKRQQLLNNANNGQKGNYPRYFPDLLSISVGGIDCDDQYDLVIADKLGEKYIPKSFSFSGANFNFIYINKFAWGTENNANNFIPLLVHKNYQEIKQPYYQFFWLQELGENGSNFPLNDNPFVSAGIPIVGLNYNFKIPRSSGIQWGSNNAVSRAVFGSFSHRNIPKIAKDKVYVLRRGRTIQNFIDNANKKNFLVAFFLPVVKNIDGFLVTADNKNFCVSSLEYRRDLKFGDIMLPKIKYFSKNGKILWQCAAKSPIIENASGNSIFAMSLDYRRILKINKLSGKVSVLCEVPKYLPRTLNSFMLFKTLKNGQEKTYLTLIVPLQSRLYCFSL